MTEKEKFNLQYPTPDMINCIADKLRYYRYAKGLHQSQVADYVGIDRTTYINYEAGMDYYPIDMLSKAAHLFEISLIDLLDKYHKFLYEGQGRQIREIRKNTKLSQQKIAEKLGVNVSTVKRWENDTIRIRKINLKNLISGD